MAKRHGHKPRRHGGASDAAPDYADLATRQVDLSDIDTADLASPGATVDLGAAKRRASIVPGYDPLRNVGNQDTAETESVAYDGPRHFGPKGPVGPQAPEDATGRIDMEALERRVLAGDQQAAPRAPQPHPHPHAPSHQRRAPVRAPQPAPVHVAGPGTPMTHEMVSAYRAQQLPPAPIQQRAAPPQRPQMPPADVTGESASVFMADEWENDAITRSKWPLVIGILFVLAALGAVGTFLIVAIQQQG